MIPINLQRSRGTFNQQHTFRSQFARAQQRPRIPFPLPNPILNQTHKSLSSTPLSSRLLSIPPQITQYCDQNQLTYQPSNFSSHNSFFWFSISTTFFIWHYDTITQWGSTSPQPKLLSIMNFNQKIVMGRMGKIRRSEKDPTHQVEVLVVVLTDKIVLFNYNKEKESFDAMKLEVSTNGQTVHDLLFKFGNIFYCGDQGTLKIVFSSHRFLTKAHYFKTVSSSLTTDILNNTFFFYKADMCSSSLTIIGNYAYTLIQKKYPNSWITQALIYKNSYDEEKFLRIFDIRTNALVSQIDEKSIVDKILFKAQTSIDFVRRVSLVSVFERGNRLGVSLCCGAFAYLSLEGLFVEEVFMVPLIHSKNIIAEKILNEFDVIGGMIRSLGFENLSTYYNVGTAYFNGDCFDPCYSLAGKQVMGVFEMKKTKKHYDFSMFEEARQWMCYTPTGAIQIKRLRLHDILLVYLHILKTEKQTRNSYGIFDPFNYLCGIYTSPQVCCHLMEIICNNDLEIQIEEQAYQNTRKAIFKCQRNYYKQQPVEVPTKIINRKIRTNQEIVQLAAETLNFISSRCLQSEHDILWKSILKYFNQIYNLVKNRTPEWCRSNYQVVEFVQDKMQCFKKLLEIKSLELNNLCYRKSNGDKDQDYDEMTPSFYENRISDLIPPPSGSLLRQKFDNSTPLLINRSQLLIDKISCLLDLCLLLIPGDEQQPTIHQILTYRSTRNPIRSRIFKDIQSGHPVIEKLKINFPDLFNETDQMFNQFILNPKSKTCYFSVEDLTPTLKTERIPVIKEYYYKEKNVYDFLVLLLKRMKYLQNQKIALQKDQRRNSLIFEEFDAQEMEDKIEELESNWSVIIEYFEQSIKDYILNIKNERVDNKLQLLANQIKLIEIEPITQFAKTLMMDQGLNHMVQLLSNPEQKCQIMPKPLFDWKKPK